MSILELFYKDLPPQKIVVGFETLPDISDSKSLLKGEIFQLKDISNPKRNVIINFDLEGRLTSIELGTESLDSKIKILERSFDGKFYLYSENCKNLESGKESIYRYYDYYNEEVYENLKVGKFLIDSINSLLKKIFKTGYSSTGKIILLEKKESNIDFYRKVKKISPDLIKILENIYKIYNWKGLLKQMFLLQKIYPTSINVLPPEVKPDRNPIFAIIQMTQGCWIKDLRGPCKFCASYRNIGYREKNIEELKEHIKQVKKFTGRGWKQVRKIFLTDADPFHTKIDSEVYLNFLVKEIPNVNWYEGFISTPTILLKSIDEWKRLINLGLKKVYWGVESADDKTLKLLGKQQNSRTLYRAASILNKTGMPYVVILLSGVGNLKPNQRKKELINNSHLTKTAKFVHTINCSDVYISRFMPQPGTEIFNLIKKNKLNFPSLVEREAEHRMLIKMISYNNENRFIPAREVRGTYGAQFNR